MRIAVLIFRIAGRILSLAGIGRRLGRRALGYTLAQGHPGGRRTTAQSRQEIRVECAREKRIA